MAEWGTDTLVAMSERVILHGTIQGEGRKAACRILATRVSLPGAAGVSETTHWSMRDVSEELPDGNYEVFAEGKREQVRRVGGRWLSRS